ncbi:Transcriptional regulator, LytR family protein [Enterococcus faecalis CBRD01]|nr:Transcriptional regulator, LytR family protein [Enterococcus faecalis CBRD01]
MINYWRKNMSKGKKIFAIIFGIILVLFLAVVGMGAKLYWDVSKSMDKTYETVERSKKKSGQFKQ